MTDLGAVYLGEGRCRFRVWAPRAGEVAVHVLEPVERLEGLERQERGYHAGEVADLSPGSLYRYVLDGDLYRPDPASRFQPQGVHGPSQVVDGRSFTWSDGNWRGPARWDLIFYEIHVGTYTPAGTFEAIVPCLDGLADLGITAIELMPVAQFPGSRNWGYDGVFPFAVHASYGGPRGLKHLVDECHRRGLAVFLDVVYNHLGPEGNCLADFAPYFTDRYRTPWGQAVNFDGPGSDQVRHFFIENALYWVEEFHLDGLRLDAVHAIVDRSATPFLEELAAAVHRLGRRQGRTVHVIAESDLNDPRLIQPRAIGGFGLDGQWNDDFHHALHPLLTGEVRGYFRDFGTVDHLARAFREGYVYTGQFSPFRGRRHGRPPAYCEPDQFVVYARNHDQVGNRPCGERLASLVSLEGLKVAAAVVLLSPFLPLLFMGEEYGETAPFQYFTSHSTPSLVKAVRKGRREEFADFSWPEKVPDPQDEKTFLDSRLDHDLAGRGWHQRLRELYRNLIGLRRHMAAQGCFDGDRDVFVREREMVIAVRYGRALMVCSFGHTETDVTVPLPPGSWEKRLDTAAERWLGGGTSVPDVLVSGGGIHLILPSPACILLERKKER